MQLYRKRVLQRTGYIVKGFMQGKDGGIPSKATATKIKRSEQCGIM